MAAIPVPPIPPPPPPPPPPAPACGLTRMDSGRKQRLRNLNWERIPKERVEGRNSVWSGSLNEDDDFRIDLNSLDELFGQKEGGNPDRTNSFRRSLLCCRSPQETSIDKVTLLDSKRSMNVGIFLRQLKIAANEIVEDVRQGAGERYGAEKLTELCKLLPDNEEEARLKKFSGDRSLLAEPDLFMLLLVELPSFRMLLDAMILQQEFDPAVTSLCVAARCLGEAARELLSCPELHSILRLVLKAGNYMNAGGYAGNAAGFRISSLLKLADTKANKPGMNLLHFVAMEAVKKDKDLLMFPSRLSHVAPASRLSEESVAEDLSRLHSRVAELQIRAQTDTEIEQQTRTFLEVAEVRLKEAADEVEILQSASKALVEFFCEDENSFKLEEACRIFQCFCQRFQRAVRENTERELQEQRRVARERENVEKRRSLALCTGLEVERQLDDLDRALQRSLSYTGTRRSLRRHSQYILCSVERNMKSDKQHPNSESGTLHALSPEGFSGESELRRHSLRKNDAVQTEQGINKGLRVGQCLSSTDSTCGLQRGTMVTPNSMKNHSTLNTRTVLSDTTFVALGETSITSHQQGAANVLPLTGLSSNNVLKVEKQVQGACERLTQIATDASEGVEKQDRVNGKEAPSVMGVTPETDAETATSLVGETWLNTFCPVDPSPPLARELEPSSPDRSHVYPRVGETLECHTLVRGLRSYESISATVTRPAANHCSKWKKEREAKERDGASLPHANDLRTIKTPTRGPTKRGLVPHGGPSNSSGIPRVRTKAEPTPVDGLSASHISRLSPTSSTYVRSSLITRFNGVQNELKHNASAGQKLNAQSETKQKRNASETVNQDKDKCREPFVRGSPLRVSKRLAPNSDSQTPHAIHSPTAATTAKTIRTAIITAAKAAKSPESAFTKSLGSRIPGTKIPRPAAQPTWR
ncbi:disheveled-associated activator of morphogenesis 1-A [Myxocyprinus asiaticus]|uniref:disheveled-associated activator of morphogenesis 1-A n=1 Tax=Myxocyprinus asiaticus TaxID=70543 RepID=UPI002223A042|nr:disheveled-associated activator of morphogenesis 1-A [Myxocyprinus asiaticus]